MRLLLVSNRLPVTVKLEDSSVAVVQSQGGLATGLAGPHQQSGGLWIGWPGDVSKLDSAQREALESELARLRAIPVYLSSSEISRFYESFSNGVLWPLFHYLLDRIPVDARDWETYQQVNQRFADKAAEHYRDGDLVWVQDYQLALVPALLRARIPSARIGYFLHIPFPASEVFRILPWRTEILEGMLGADLIGFHTTGYARHFANALLHVLGLPAQVDKARYRGRDVHFGAHPMGVDVATFTQPDDLSSDDDVATLRQRPPGHKLLLGIDRLDYTKGIPRRLLAVERLLEREPEWRGKLRFIQVAVPSRTVVEEYKGFRREVDELVGRINGAHGSVNEVPIHYLYRGFNQVRLAALYRAADVMLVTPLRDGMNLVAKEFCAARTDGDGALVLSEFTGAASELAGALLVNPYNIDQMATVISQALNLPEEERRVRMAALRRRVTLHDVHRWARHFLDTLASLPAPAGPIHRSPQELDRALEAVAAAPVRVLLLDYDGTLVGFQDLPELALPGNALKSLLARLAKNPRNRVHVVSGRTRETMQAWLSDLPIGLHAEHGLWSRPVGGQWTVLREVPIDWKDQVRPILEQFAMQTPGAIIEEKTATIVWHYRMADGEFGELQAHELHIHLAHTLSNLPVEILPGRKVIEIRPHGVHKGAVVARALAEGGDDCVALAIGDDRTDEDMFAALPPNAVAIHVGQGDSRAPYRLTDVRSVRELLIRFI